MLNICVVDIQNEHRDDSWPCIISQFTRTHKYIVQNKCLLAESRKNYQEVCALIIRLHNFRCYRKMNKNKLLANRIIQSVYANGQANYLKLFKWPIYKRLRCLYWCTNLPLIREYGLCTETEKIRVVGYLTVQFLEYIRHCSELIVHHSCFTNSQLNILL